MVCETLISSISKHDSVIILQCCACICWEHGALINAIHLIFSRSIAEMCGKASPMWHSLLGYLVVYKPDLRPNLQPKENIIWISFESHQEIWVQQKIIFFYSYNREWEGNGRSENDIRETPIKLSWYVYLVWDTCTNLQCWSLMNQ